MKTPILRVPGRGLNPLTKYSLLGSAAELEKHALEQKPLLGSICLTGEATVWYAKFGTGKTLLCLHLTIEAIQDGRIAAGDVFYINADDSSAGLAQKVKLLQDYGVNVLAPGHRGFRANMLVEKMKEMIDTGSANGVFLIFDTLKRYVDVMSKAAVAAFTEVIRQFVMKRGTVLALAHTNKRPGSDGKPIPEGTGDVLNDFDCGYLLDTVGEEKETHYPIVEFSRQKSRGPAASKAYYVYDPEAGLKYTERLASIREVSPEDDKFGDRFSFDNTEESDIIFGIEQCLEHGTVTKMDIIRTTAMATKTSRRTALKVLENYTGDDPELHRWNFTVREHGRMVYAPLVPASDAG